MQDWYQRLQFDRLIVLSALAAAGVLLTLRAAMPLLVVAVVVLLGVVAAALRQVVVSRGDDARWMLTPLLLTLANAIFWRIIPDERAALIGSALFGMLFLFALMDYHQHRSRRNAQSLVWPNQAIVYIALFMIFATFSAWNLDLLLYAALAGAAAYAGGIALLFRQGVQRGAMMGYSLLLALVIGEVSWALSYWPLPTFEEPLALLLHVHVGFGLVRAHYAGKLRFSLALEYGTICAIVAALILWTTLRSLG